MAIGKIQFNKEGVKRLTLSEFRNLYKGKLGDKTDDTYYELTGKSKPKRKNKKSEEEE